MIERTKQEVEAYCTIDNGQEHNADVKYGDAGFVMVKFGPADLKTVMRLGGEAADHVLTKFERLIKSLSCNAWTAGSRASPTFSPALNSSRLPNGPLPSQQPKDAGSFPLTNQ